MKDNNNLKNQIDWFATIVPMVGVAALCILFMALLCKKCFIALPP